MKAMAKIGVARLTIGNRHEHRDHQPGEEHHDGVALAQFLGLVRRVKAHGGELEIFAAEQIGVGQQQDDHAEPGEQNKRQRAEIDHEREQRELHTLDQRAEKRQRAARRLRRIMRVLDHVGDVIDKETADKGGHRRHQEQRAGDDAEAGHQREHEGKRCPGGVRRKARGLLGPGGAVVGERGDQTIQADADDDDQQQREADGFEQHAAQAWREKVGKR